MKESCHRDTYTKMECMIPSDVLLDLPVVHEHKRNLKDRFRLIRTLGEGTYGKVKLAEEILTGELFAIKYIKKSKIQDQHDLNRIRREIKIMSSLHHPHIVRVSEVFENKDRIILVMECANGGELYDYINNNKLSEKDARRIFRQIVSAISFCHKKGIVHRDLKLENILLDHNNDAKIADFGLSNYYNYASLLETFCGSPLYASPEIVNGQKYHGPEVDCWSLGVVLYTLVYGTMPFDGTNFKKLKTQISMADYFEPADPSEAAGLIRHLLTANPAKRANIMDICSHWWVNLGYKDMPNGEPYVPSMVLQPVPCTQNLSSSSESDDGEPMNRSKPKTVKPLKGILKKPKFLDKVDSKCNENSSQDAILVVNENANPLEAQQEDNVFTVNETQTGKQCDTSMDQSTVTPQQKISAEPATDATFIIDTLGSKKVFDSQRMPARGILKRKGKFSAGDSGCDLNSPVMKESSNVRSMGMDVSEGDSALESPSLCNSAEKIQNNSDTKMDQQGAFSFHIEENKCSQTAADFAKEGPGLSHSVVPRRKGILKNKNYSKDESYKRLSACSTGSNSSADILNFSYDSSDESLQLMKYYREDSNSTRSSLDVELCYSRTESHSTLVDDMIDFEEARNVCKQAIDILKDS